MNYQDRISIEPGKRSGKPCICGMRITVYDVLEYLASGMSEQEIIDDFPDLTQEDIRACLAFAADRERKLVSAIDPGGYSLTIISHTNSSDALRTFFQRQRMSTSSICMEQTTIRSGKRTLVGLFPAKSVIMSVGGREIPQAHVYTSGRQSHSIMFGKRFGKSIQFK
jgi:uncharacterized protein (DUF433 family)